MKSIYTALDFTKMLNGIHAILPMITSIELYNKELVVLAFFWTRGL